MPPKYYPPVPFVGSPVYHFKTALENIAKKLPAGTFCRFVFGGSGADANLFKKTNPALKIAWNDADDYAFFLRHFDALKSLVAKSGGDKESLRALAANLWGKERGDQIAEMMRRGVKLNTESPRGYLAGCVRTSKIYHSPADISGMPADLYILDPPWNAKGHTPYLPSYRAMWREENGYKIGRDFALTSRKPCLWLNLAPMPGFHTIAKARANYNRDLILLLANCPALELINGQKS